MAFGERGAPGSDGFQPAVSGILPDTSSDMALAKIGYFPGGRWREVVEGFGMSCWRRWLGVRLVRWRWCCCRGIWRLGRWIRLLMAGGATGASLLRGGWFFVVSRVLWMRLIRRKGRIAHRRGSLWGGVSLLRLRRRMRGTAEEGCVVVFSDAAEE